MQIVLLNFFFLLHILHSERVIYNNLAINEICAIFNLTLFHLIGLEVLRKVLAAKAEGSVSLKRM